MKEDNTGLYIGLGVLALGGFYIYSQSKKTTAVAPAALPAGTPTAALPSSATVSTAANVQANAITSLGTSLAKLFAPSTPAASAPAATTITTSAPAPSSVVAPAPSYASATIPAVNLTPSAGSSNPVAANSNLYFPPALSATPAPATASNPNNLYYPPVLTGSNPVVDTPILDTGGYDTDLNIQSDISDNTDDSLFETFKNGDYMSGVNRKVGFLK